MPLKKKVGFWLFSSSAMCWLGVLIALDNNKSKRNKTDFQTAEKTMEN